MMELNYKTYSAYDLFDISENQAIPGTPPWMNLSLGRLVNPGNEFSGPGIYACFYENKLIYIGKYLGQRDDPFAGDIISLRWIKHIATFTLRGRRQSFSKRALTSIAQTQQYTPGTDIVNSDSEILRRDRGLFSSYNRYVFAAEKWETFSALSREDLKAFEFVYIQVEQLSDSTLDNADICRIISNAEDQLVKETRPRCNAIIEFESSHSELSAKTIRKSIVDKLSADFNHETITQGKTGEIVIDEAQDDDKVEPEQLSAEMEFFDRVGAINGAVDLLFRIIETFETNSDVEVHYSHVPDLRIRAYAVSRATGNLVSQNVMRIQWQINNQRFLCESYLPLALYPEGYDEREYPHGPLNTQFSVTPSSPGFNMNSFVDLIQTTVKFWCDERR